MVRKAGALVRASWLEAASYRARMVVSVVGMIVALGPLYYVAHAVQPVVAKSIAQEGADYFAFLLVGLMTSPFVRTSISALPGELGSAISTGTLEALLGTPTRIATLLLGMVGYPFVWAAIRCAVVAGFGWAMGAHLTWTAMPIAVTALALIVLVYLAIGVFGAAMILAFRTSGPLEPLAVWASSLLGGVYFPTQAIPAWLQHVSSFVPLTYGLRAFRHALLGPSAAWSVIALDLLPLAAMGVVLCSAALLAFAAALRYARRAGTLSQY